MSLRDLVKDDYGYPIELTFYDTDDESAANISAYSTAQYMVFKDPSGNESEKSASFKTDGSDGVVTYTVQEGDIDEAGTWQVRLKVESGSATKRSKWYGFHVHD